MDQPPQSDGTVGKALAVLDLVASFERPARFGELLPHAPFPKATLYRFLQTLTSQGMLLYDPERQTYALGVRLVRLAHAAWRHSSLAPIARPALEALSRDLGETVHLAQLDHAQVLYVDKRNARNPVEMYSAAGKVAPVYCTGIGKAMLAYLPASEQDVVIAQQSFHRFTPNTLDSPEALRADLQRIRAGGYSFDREEHEPGIICIALPVLTGSGRVLGGVSITSTTRRTSLDGLERLGPRIAQAAAEIARAVEHWRFPEDTDHSKMRTA